MTSEFLVLPSVNPEDLISGSNSGLRVVGGFHKSLEQQKTVPPKSHPFSGVKSDQLVYWSFKLGWHPPVTRMVKLWETCQILCDRPQRDLFFPGLLADASVVSKKICSSFSIAFEPLFAGSCYLRFLYRFISERIQCVIWSFRKATGVSCGLGSLTFAVFWPVLSVHTEVIICWGVMVI